MSKRSEAELVTIAIDGKELRVPKGMNIVDAAAEAGIEIPHYCYHRDLSIAGNCRMCQVEIEGQPKLAIACNTTAAEGLKIKTHYSSPAVVESQRATLEFLLINHPLDCTVCDQAGHCKLQDYYYEYNATASRFIEDKVHKVKAEPLGPEVIYDGERCIMCTRCVRFCEEVTGTAELGAFNRGDKGVIGVVPGKELTNALSGTVVDLCPVGALTHRRWRFNTRIWYTGESDTVCAGCSTGCNVKVAVRDDKIVQVKARYNAEVNKEWLCDEGRYGFERFQPQARLTAPMLRATDGADGFKEVSWDEALKQASALTGSAADAAVFLSPFLTLEEIWLASELAERVMGASWASGSIVMGMKQRKLSAVEAVLVSPDYAPNARAAHLFGQSGTEDNWRDQLESRYKALLTKLRQGAIKRVLLVGDGAIVESDLDNALSAALSNVSVSVALSASAVSGQVHENCKVLFPARTVNEKSGLMVNAKLRLQRLKTLISGPMGSLADWLILNRISAAAGKAILPKEVADERAVFFEMVKNKSELKGLTLARIGAEGIPLSQIGERVDSGQGASASA